MTVIGLPAMVNDGASLTAVTEIVNVWAEVVIAAPPAVASSVNVTVKTAVPFALAAGVKMSWPVESIDG